MIPDVPSQIIEKKQASFPTQCHTLRQTSTTGIPSTSTTSIPSTSPLILLAGILLTIIPTSKRTHLSELWLHRHQRPRSRAKSLDPNHTSSQPLSLQMQRVCHRCSFQEVVCGCSLRPRYSCMNVSLGDSESRTVLQIASDLPLLRSETLISFFSLA